MDARNLLYRDHVTEVTRLGNDVLRAQQEARAATNRAEDAESEATALREKLDSMAAGESERSAALQSAMLKMRLDKVTALSLFYEAMPLAVG